jgi:hypothetical protein
VAIVSLSVVAVAQIIQWLPVAPGMTTFLTFNDNVESKEDSKRNELLVHCYYRDRRSFLVSKYLPDNNGQRHDQKVASRLVEVSEDALSTAPSAQFYPLLESLQWRAEQAAALLRTSSTTKQIVDKTGRVLVQTTAGLSSIISHQTTTDSDTGIDTSQPPLEATLQTLVSRVEQAAPETQQQISQVWTMVKDEEITVLLETCRRRLQQLVDSAAEISETTRLALEQTGIRIHLPDNEYGSEAHGQTNSQRAALSAIAQLLHQVSPSTDLNDANQLVDVVRTSSSEIVSTFTVALEALSQAAQSDRGLNEAFEALAAKTAVWQQATGRLLTTRSASLFLEGANRIQTRAVAMFSNHHGELVGAMGEIGSKLTKSFTEGDAALSRLKSIELGEALKGRLVEAIEVRSESMGGLDGIIAGALSNAAALGGSGGGQIQELLQQLQQNASSASVSAHETLLAVLSSRSSYREVTLMRLERTLCDLGNRIGDGLSPVDIASIVRGEGGTEKLFEPIAKKAMEQIQKQLDAAESQVKDTTVLGVLKRVRRLLSGDLTLNDILDDIVSVLNDDKIVAAGESIVQQSERVLDAIEGVSASKAVTDAIQIAEKAGITKSSVMREFEKLNMDDLLGVAQQAVSDESARQQLLSSATDAALDFVLLILPSMPVPPFEGVKDGLVYHLSNLSMKGFRVKKEDIHIEIAGMRATRHANDSKAHNAPGYADNGTNSNGGHSHYERANDNEVARAEDNYAEYGTVRSSIKATELLIIDIRNTSAVLNNAVWSFEQTYMPYLKGGGSANAVMSGGSIRLQFELRKRRKSPLGSVAETPECEPVLCLHDRSCIISEVELSLDGDGRITWLLNKIAPLFKAPLRDFVVSSIIKVLTHRSGWILERLNIILAPYWDLILRTAKLQMVSPLLVFCVQVFNCRVPSNTGSLYRTG